MSGHAGPGATNLVTGVADANMDHAPVVAISGQSATTRMHKESHQYLDLVNLFRPISKYCSQVVEPETIAEVVRKAFKRSRPSSRAPATSTFPRTSPRSILSSWTPLPIAPARPARAGTFADSACRRDDFKSPRLSDHFGGNGVIRAGGFGEPAGLRRKAQYPRRHHLHGQGGDSLLPSPVLGAVGLQARDVVSCGFDRADVIVCVGYDMVEWAPSAWNPNKPVGERR